MKKLLALILSFALALSCASSLAENQETNKNEAITVAVTTPLTGNFFTSMWGNASSDVDVRFMIHGYNLIQWNSSIGVFEHDPSVVTDIYAERTAGGQKYTITLAGDLKYSDGTPITAWDYAFSWLLTASPVLEELGANVRHPEYILGCRDYASGKSKVLTGVHVVHDRRLEITIDSAYIPFFYQEGLLDCVPYPISQIAPGAQIADDGNGVYLKGEMTAETLKETILGENGYRTHPTVTSGAYRLVSFEDGVAEFEANPYYKGNAEGKKPTIRKITMLSMASEEMVQALKDGRVTILNKVSDAQVIAECLNLEGTANKDYDRSGLSFISFNTEKAPLDDLMVRQAIAYIADRDGVAEEALGEYGETAEGYFGKGQWMYKLLSGQMEGAVQADVQAKLEELKLEDIESYARDTEKGAALLDEAGWKLGEDGLRYKDGQALQLTLAYTKGSAAGAALEGKLAASLAEAGIGLTIEAIDGNELLNEYYRLSEGQYDMLFLGTNFDVIYDPSTYFTETDGQHIWTTSGLADEQLWKLANGMRMTQPGDAAEYCRKWLAFEERFMEILPALPIYTNTYYDFYPEALQDYTVDGTISWPQAIIGAHME